MDHEPLNQDITREDKEFSMCTVDWNHIATQVNDELHADKDEPYIGDGDVRRVLELLGVTLRSCNGPELMGIFQRLDIDLQALLTEEGTSISELLAHEHADFRVLTEPITDELPTWSIKCRKCGVGRRVVRTD